MLRKIPNILTVGRNFNSTLFCISILSSRFLWRLNCSYFIYCCFFTDFLDGMLARLLGEESKLGELLDPIADKIIVATALILLVMDGTIRHYEVIAAIIILPEKF
jgi:CDP-diacylglycerol--glycerol-3-phosphate 3-phosphatidyltransferase/cardiolipin synthase